jgi:hypothetical protein
MPQNLAEHANIMCRLLLRNQSCEIKMVVDDAQHSLPHVMQRELRDVVLLIIRAVARRRCRR